MFDLTNINILFEDQWLIALDKPSGLATQSTVQNKNDNLFDLLKRSQRWPYLALHHRLDVPTSGVILLSKDKNINTSLTELFRGREIKKTYLALVSGIPSWQELQVKNKLKERYGRNGKKIMRESLTEGDIAITDFKLIKPYESFSLVEAKPQTGRMHQIRVHLAGINLPILGDALYYRVDRKYPRLLLHAHSLEFIHPMTKENLIISSELPKDFKKYL